MSILFEVEDLSILRDQRLILQVERLAINEGEVLAVIGPNGAGKSTLLLALSGLLKPERGRFNFRGNEVVPHQDLAFRRRIGLVLQDPLLLDTSVFNNVAAGLRFRGIPLSETTRRSEEWLRRLGIAALHNRRAGELSGGEAQRVSLARAFVLLPELLLLDEPFSALDAPTRARLLADLHALLAELSVTTVFVTHDLDEALLLGDRVAVMLNGQIRQEGPPQEVFTAPRDGEVAAFVGVETVLPGKVAENKDGLVVIETNGLRLEAVGELNLGRLVLFCLRPEDITLWPRGDAPVSSARNRLQGKILRLSPQGPLVHVVIDCGFPLFALVTRASAREMELAEGMPVTAAFKASAAHLIPR